MKRGDLKPDLTITCTSDGSSVDLTTAASVQVVIRKVGDAAALFTRTATGDANGVVTMTWQAGDTDTVGQYATEVLVTWPGSRPQRFPGDSYLTFRIVDNLS